MTAHPLRTAPNLRSRAWTAATVAASIATAVALTLWTLPSLADTPSRATDAAQSQYQRDRARCASGQSGQSRSDCEREADAAYAEARKGVLGKGPAPDPAAAARQRCAPFHGDDHEACMARAMGLGKVSGSVKGGGVLHELVTVQPATPNPSAAADPKE